MIYVSIGFTILFSFTMILFGYYLKRFTPKKINGVIGYRSKWSMLNNDTWLFAHQKAGNYWLLLGLIILPISLFPFILDTWFDLEIPILMLIYVQITLMISVIPYTEIRLRRHFDSNGKSK